VDGMLLYAKTQEDIVPDDKMQLKAGNTIYFRALDLNQEFAGICNRLENLIENKE
jgi:5-methylcytosine-specific restriction enzyme subunit McrC